MSILYGRAASLTVGIPGKPGLKITQLRMNFKIEKTSESNPNTSQINVYNLTDDQRSNLEAKGGKITFMAGYGALINSSSNLSLLFKGDVARTSSKKQGPDIITTFEVGDGLQAIKAAAVDKSFAPGTPLTSIFSSLGDSLGVSTGSIKGLPSGGTANGYVASGLSRDRMDELTKQNGLEWSIQDDALQILPINAATDEPVIIIDITSGLIGSPHKLVGDKAKKRGGVQFESLLLPGLKPGRRVRIDSRFIDKALYVVRKVSHEGDTHQGDWKSVCEAVEAG